MTTSKRVKKFVPASEENNKQKADDLSISTVTMDEGNKDQCVNSAEKKVTRSRKQKISTETIDAKTSDAVSQKCKTTKNEEANIESTAAATPSTTVSKKRKNTKKSVLFILLIIIYSPGVLILFS